MKKEKENKKDKGKIDHVPACMDSSDKNLKDKFYCWFCDMAWYNCLCCHEE